MQKMPGLMGCNMIGHKVNNRYEIREHIGDGSTATVYKAFDSMLAREVALKMMLPHVRDTTRERFLQEATAAAQLNHPNIMAIYDRGVEDDRHYLVVEFVEGVSLSHYVPSKPEVVVRLGAQIARALQYAHDLQIIHRDIKPANIKVTSDEQVKIMDLGLALPREAKRVTAHGMVIGTPAYLSPEQAQGFELDHRTDIYSLGIVLYEMATGQLPFNADDVGALLLQQVKQAVPPPRLIVPDLPLALENVIVKSLGKQPEQRYQSCTGLAAALEASLPGHLVTTGTPSGSAAIAQTLEADGVRNVVRPPPAVMRIILADDHTILRKTLASFLEDRDDIVVMAEAGDGDTALQTTLAILPDVLVLDLNMPGKGGLDILPDLRAKAPQVKVLVLTGRGEEAYIMRALRLGAHGYILKSADEDELVESIFKVMQDQLVLGKGVAEKIVTGLIHDGPVPDDKLDDKELEVLLFVAAGYQNDAIARELELSVPMLIEILAGAIDKLQAKDRHSAALKALRLGYILLDDLHDLPKPPDS